MTSQLIPEHARALRDFQPGHDFFVGIDSDGCAMDAMDIKHQECFTPAYIKYFNLQAASGLVRETALFVNLYSSTRGQNRWVALDRLFELLRQRPEVLSRGVQIPEGGELRRFLDSGFPRSDAGIAAFAAEHPSAEIETCIEWGRGVNELIAWMVHGCAPFDGVREAIRAMQDLVDCMVVSATPVEALQREWAEHDLARHMRVIAGQEMGSKAEHLRWAAKGRYRLDRIMLIGDAPGDRDTAAEEGVLFYPILPGDEVSSWRRFKDEALSRFLDGTFAGSYQEQLLAQYDQLLPEVPPWSRPVG
ncbi:HAD family hydrolase [Arachnia propionica]|uniref:HAD family hydrolase n=1 Tax=Arachnia propionica TaxID=1750 RepID=A0A3P1T9T6_9ACTN|nr:HAD family hydrolase [Arachnia propionica]RRD06058.1 HAD family hydrolase [Arachnia propionica]